MPTTLIHTLPAPPPADADATGQRNYWTAYGWPGAGDEWSAPWGSTAALWHSTLLPRLRAFLPAAHALEIGCGMGRVSALLRPWCERLTLVDVTPRCAEACARRFEGDAGVTCAVTDGRTLPGVEAASIDLCVSWESLVYAEQATLAAYFRELARVLKPGGAALIHHSNLGAHERELEGKLPDERTAGRRFSQTAPRVAADAQAAGLRCVAQELIPFYDRGLWTDCLTLVTRDDLNAARPPEVAHAHDWPSELTTARRVDALYRA